MASAQKKACKGTASILAKWQDLDSIHDVELKTAALLIVRKKENRREIDMLTICGPNRPKCNRTPHAPIEEKSQAPWRSLAKETP